MRKTLTVFSLTFVFLVAIDGAVALTLGWAERAGRLGGLVQYFEYGRSVPGKLERWEQTPDAPGNLYDVAWRSHQVAASAARFATENDATKTVIRSYGMSFVNNIIRRAIDLRPDLNWDNHAGPGAPPNFTYALFEDDRDNRREGDIVVFGILSSSVPAMAALSNSTWAFEQPAPLTYPIYLPEADGLRRIEPLVASPAEQRALSGISEAQQAWRDQLDKYDLFFGPQTFGVIWADRSPFLRLVRRSLATSHIARTNAEVLGGAYPYETVLERMITDFARQARTKSQTPIVMLIQTRDPRNPDVLAITRSVLERDQIPYLATADIFDPRDPSGFLADGHYTTSVDRLFAEHLLNLIAP